MSLKYTWLIAVAMCAGPSNDKCTEDYIQSVRKYTMDSCMRVFRDYVKCDELANNRVKELRQQCSQ